MCGCAAGAAVRAARQQTGQAVVFLGQPTESTPCEYEIEQLKTWRAKLICAKDKALYQKLNIPARTLNAYIGIVISAINYNTNPCYFRKQLDEIADFMGILINDGTC